MSAGPRVADMNPLVELVFGPLLTVHQWLYEHSDGRIGASLGGRPMLLLRTVGRRTGQPRTSALLYVRDGDAYVVIASKGGAPRHPGWFHNLTAQPDVEIQVGRERIPVRARVAEGKERSRLWARADEVNQGQYAEYQSRTNRVIPVVVLERMPSKRSGRTSGSDAPARGPGDGGRNEKSRQAAPASPDSIRPCSYLLPVGESSRTRAAYILKAGMYLAQC